MTDNPNLPLTDKQRKFVDALVQDPDHNAAAAARTAGYSAKSAKEQAHALLKHPGVQKAVQKGMDEIAEGVGVTKERMLQELAKIAFADLNQIVDTETGYVDLTRLPRGAQITEIELVKGGRKPMTKIKISAGDRRQAIIDILKLMGWMKDKVEVQGTLSLESLIRSSFEVASIDAQEPKEIIDADVIEAIPLNSSSETGIE